LVTVTARTQITAFFPDTIKCSYVFNRVTQSTCHTAASAVSQATVFIED